MKDKHKVEIIKHYLGYIVHEYMINSNDNTKYCEKSTMFENLSDARDYKNELIG